MATPLMKSPSSIFPRIDLLSHKQKRASSPEKDPFYCWKRSSKFHGFKKRFEKPGSASPRRSFRFPFPEAAQFLLQLSRQHQPKHVKRSEEHTSELQSRENLVCRLLLEKKNNA